MKLSFRGGKVVLWMHQEDRNKAVDLRLMCKYLLSHEEFADKHKACRDLMNSIDAWLAAVSDDDQPETEDQGAEDDESIVEEKQVAEAPDLPTTKKPAKKQAGVESLEPVPDMEPEVGDVEEEMYGAYEDGGPPVWDNHSE